MLDKTEVPTIPEGYSLVVAMNALLDAIRSVSLVINDEVTSTATPTHSPDVVPKPAAKGAYVCSFSRSLVQRCICWKKLHNSCDVLIY